MFEAPLQLFSPAAEAKSSALRASGASAVGVQFAHGDSESDVDYGCQDSDPVDFFSSGNECNSNQYSNPVKVIDAERLNEPPSKPDDIVSGANASTERSITRLSIQQQQQQLQYSGWKWGFGSVQRRVKYTSLLL